MNGYRLDVEPNLIEFVEAVRQVVASHALVGKLGTDWRVTVERKGRPAAEIRRTRDHGLHVGFYGDDVAPEERP